MNKVKIREKVPLAARKKAITVIDITKLLKIKTTSCDCISKETLWNRSEKVDHLAYKYWCVLQGSGIIKMIRNLGPVFVKLQALYTER